MLRGRSFPGVHVVKRLEQTAAGQWPSRTHPCDGESAAEAVIKVCGAPWLSADVSVSPLHTWRRPCTPAWSG